MSTGFHRLVNNATTVLVANRAPGEPLQVQDGTLFGDLFPLLVSLYRQEQPLCILEITGRTGDLLDVSGAVDGSQDQYCYAGDVASCSTSSLYIEELQEAVNTLETVVEELAVGGGGPSNTDGLPEGTTNLYFTPTRANTAVAPALAGKAPTVHTHPQSDITGLVTALAGKAATVHTHAESDITNLVADLAGKAPTVHTHTTAQVTGLDSALAGKAATVHQHAESDVTNLVSDLAGKAPLVHAHSGADITSGLVAPARLGSGSPGAGNFLRGDGSWQVVSAGGGPANTDALPEGTTNLYYSDTRAQAANAAALAGKAATVHQHSAGDVTSGVFGTARLGTGTADGTTFLRGDGTWAVATGGSSTPPGGANRQLQFNSSGAFGGIVNSQARADGSVAIAGGGNASYGLSVAAVGSGSGLYVNTGGTGNGPVASFCVGTSPVVQIQSTGSILTASSGASTDRPLTVKGFAGQSVPLTEWQNSAGAVLSSVSSGGVFTGPGSGLTDLTPGNIAAGTAGISVTGNAGTVTNGLYSTGSYANPSWLTSLAGSKLTGNIPGNSASITGSITESQVTNLVADLAGKAPTVHTHAESDITNLVSDLAGKAPTNHTHTTAQVTGLDTQLAGKAATVHQHSGADITTGVVAPARLGSGTPGAGNFLRGDGSWQAVAAGGAPGGSSAQLQYNQAGAFGGAARLTYNSTGDILTVNSGVDSDVALVVTGAVDQGANLQEWRDSDGTVLASLQRDGTIEADGYGLRNLRTSALFGIVDPAQLGTGTPTTSTFLRGDGTWQAPPPPALTPAGGIGQLQYNAGVLAGTALVTYSATGTILSAVAGASGDVPLVAKAFGNNGTTVAFRCWDSSNLPVLTVNDLGSVSLGASGVFTGSGSGLTALNAGQLSTGFVSPARMGTGTPDATVFLRGDGSWQVVGAAGNTGELQYNNAGALAGSNRATIGNTATSTTLTLIPGGISGRPLVCKGFSVGQLADLQQWQNSAGTAVASVGPAGVFTGPGSGLTALNASQLTTGTVAPARLGTGTPGTGNFLRGDGSWQAAGPANTDALPEGTTNLYYSDSRAQAALAPALAGVVHTTGTESIAGAKTFTNPVTVFGDGLTQPTVGINGAAGQVRDLAFRSAGVNRWLFRVDNVAEGGGNAGSNFLIEARTDAGGYIGDWLQINRATGLVSLGAATISQAGVFTGSGFPLPFSFGGTGVPTVLDDVAPWLYVGYPTTAARLTLSCKTAPTGPFSVTVKRSSDGGASFPDTVASATVASGAKTATVTAMTTAGLLAGDLLRCDVTAVNGAADWSARLSTLTRNY